MNFVKNKKILKFILDFFIFIYYRIINSYFFRKVVYFYLDNNQIIKNIKIIYKDSFVLIDFIRIKHCNFNLKML